LRGVFTPSSSLDRLSLRREDAMGMRRSKAMGGVVTGLMAGVLAAMPVTAQQGQAPPPDPNVGVRLEVIEGSKAFYRVREQLAGISFPNDAVGTTENVTGVLVILP